jgi:Domain of unknown function (DUF5664)
MVKFLLESRQGWPTPAQEASTSEPSEVSKMAGSISDQVASTVTDSVAGCSGSSGQANQPLRQYEQILKALLSADSPKLPLPSQESDPQGLSAKVPGAKLDAGKVDIMRGAWFYFPRALRQIARVSEAGARKYSWKGWEKVPDGITRYTAAMGRHIFEDPFATDNGPGGLGEEYLHAAQVCWNSCARLELIMRELEENEKNNKS